MPRWNSPRFRLAAAIGAPRRAPRSVRCVLRRSGRAPGKCDPPRGRALSCRDGTRLGSGWPPRSELGGERREAFGASFGGAVEHQVSATLLVAELFHAAMELA